MRNALLCTAVVLVVSGLGCSSSSTSATTDAGGGKDGSNGTDTGAPPTDSGGGGEGGAVCTGTADLYHRLGCEAGITAAPTSMDISGNNIRSGTGSDRIYGPAYSIAL